MAQRPPSKRQVAWLRRLADMTGQTFDSNALKYGVACHIEIQRLQKLRDTPEKAKEQDEKVAFEDRVGIQVFDFDVDQAYAPEVHPSEVSDGSFSETSWREPSGTAPTFSDPADLWEREDSIGIMSKSPNRLKKDDASAEEQARIEWQEQVVEYQCG
jgi:hypothetical protein